MRPLLIARAAALATLAALLLPAACGDILPSVDKDPWQVRVTPAFDLDPDAPVLPTPIDIPNMTVSPSGVTAPIPAGSPPAYEAFVGGFLNTLDGWALNSTIAIPMTGRIDAESVDADSVQVFDLTGDVPQRADGFALSVVPMNADEPEGASQIVLTPVSPMARERTYGVLVRGGTTEGVLDAAGDPIVEPLAFGYLKVRSDSENPTAPVLYDIYPTEGGAPRWVSNTLLPANTVEEQMVLATLESIRQGYDQHLSLLEDAAVMGDEAVARNEIAIFWTFSTQSDTIVEFDPLNAVLPQPNDLLRGADGTLAYPIVDTDPEAQKALFGYLNTLTGFPTAGAITFPVSGPLDAASLNETSVRVFDVTTLADISEIGGFAASFDALSSSVTIALRDPANPLDPEHSYAVVVLGASEARPETVEPDAEEEEPAEVEPDGVWDNAGQPIGRSLAMALSLLDHALIDAAGVSQLPGLLDDASAAQFEPARARNASIMLELVTQHELPADRVAAMWSFTTSGAPESLVDPNAGLVPTPNDIVNDPINLSLMLAGALGPADAGFLTWLGQQGGWSGVMGGATLLSASVDPATLRAGVRVYEQDISIAEVQDIVFDVAADGQRQLAFHRASPWTPGATYLVVVTDDLKTMDGAAYAASAFEAMIRGELPLFVEGRSQIPAALNDAEAMVIENHRAAMEPMLTVALDRLGKTREQVVAHWRFTAQPTNEAQFDPTTGVIPFPNEVLQTVEVDDAGNATPRIMVPIPEGPNGDVARYLSYLDGFSVTNPVTASFGADLDPDSLTVASSVMDVVTSAVSFADISAIEITPDMELDLGALMAIDVQSVPVDFQFDPGAGTERGPRGTLAIGRPSAAPLAEGSRFMVVLTDELRGAAGEGVGVSPAFWMARSRDPLATDEGTSLMSTLNDASASQLETLRQAYAPLFAGLDMAGEALTATSEDPFDRDDVVQFWTFRTQSITSEIAQLKDALLASPAVEAGDLSGTFIANTRAGQPGVLDDIEGVDIAAALQNVGRMVVDGQIASRYLLEDLDLVRPDSQGGPYFGRFPWGTGEEFAPYEITWNEGAKPISYDLFVPKNEYLGDAPHAMPVVLFLHGINGQRHDVVKGGMLDRFMRAGFVVIAVDLPLHGDRRAANSTETGEGFLCPDLLALRDHFLQGALDLHQVVRVLDAQLPAFLEAGMGADYTADLADLSLVGKSLGSIVAAPFLATDERIRRVVFNVPGSHFSGIVTTNDAPWFQATVRELLCGSLGGPDGIPDELAYLCVLEPGPGYEEYANFDWADPRIQELLVTLQWVLDRADPLAYASALSGRPLFIQSAGADDLFKPALADELCAAVGGDDVVCRRYDQACHTFLLRGCGGVDEPFAELARDDVIEFLTTGTLDGGRAE